MNTSNERFLCRLKEMRKAKGLSQGRIAELAGVGRQAVYDMESGKYVPNTAVALRLARILDCRVEDLFSFEEPEIERPVTLVDCQEATGTRVAIAKIGERLVGYPLDAKSLPGGSFQPAGGLLAPGRGAVRLIETEDRLEKIALVLGCDPAFALLGAHIARKVSDAGVHCRFASSQSAVERLAGGYAHLAGIHFHSDSDSGDTNLAFAREGMKGRRALLVGFSLFEEGIMVAAGNPRGIRSVEDLAGKGVRFVNRERGAALRTLLDDMLRRKGFTGKAIRGYDRIVGDHARGAQMVAYNLADGALGLRAVAASWGLDFVALETVRCDFVVPAEFMEHPAVSIILDVLQTRAFQREISALPGYEASCTGSIIGEV
ncbi:MAG: substrate-binding domain-containing protein [Syntrophobacteraceae bacterium]